ncbi:MAG: D-glycero-beta-D-manno-heptose 1-phosphate adenylyltransferase, partial [Thermomicrobiales bacterium]
RRRVVLAVDSKNVLRHSRAGATVMTPSLEEASRAVGTSVPGRKPIPLAQAIEVGQKLRKRVDAEYLAVTLADDGVIVLDRQDSVVHVPAHRLTSRSDVGAGDSFLAAIALALTVEATPDKAAQIAVDAASLAVQKERTAVVGLQELLGRVSLSHLAHNLCPEVLAAILDGARCAGKTIVFTNGVFDILHAGHVDLLRRAKSLGDVLVVGINSDASTRRLKGKNRPINHERDRLALVSALDSVDFAVLFEDDTPENLIRTLRPHIHVKGGDYSAGDLEEAEAVAEVGGRIEILPFVAGRSTTRVIDKVTALYAPEMAEALS